MPSVEIGIALSSWFTLVVCQISTNGSCLSTPNIKWIARSSPGHLSQVHPISFCSQADQPQVEAINLRGVAAGPSNDHLAPKRHFAGGVEHTNIELTYSWMSSQSYSDPFAIKIRCVPSNETMKVIKGMFSVEEI